MRALADGHAGDRARATTEVMRPSSLIVALLLVSSCGKSATVVDGTGSGALTGDEKELLHYLPAGASALFGGNFIKFQNYLQTSPFAKLLSSLDKSTPGIDAWATCWATLPNNTLVGAVMVKAAGAELRFVMKGIDFAQLQACATKASFPFILDPDGKYLGLDMWSSAGPVKGGYLKLPNGALYSRQSLPFVGGQLPPAVERAGLEADIAALSSGTLENDTTLLAEATKVDHGKAIWFVGSGAGTPLAGKVGTFGGTLEISKGLAFDVHVELTDKALADKVGSTILDAKDSGDQLGGAIGDVVKRLQFSRTGDTLRLSVAMTELELAAIVEQIAARAAKRP